jgi:hypothetical protein
VSEGTSPTPLPAKPGGASIRLTAEDFQPFTIISEAIRARTPPSTLYHYTGVAGLLGIIESGVLRLSHVSFLNDRSELTYAQELIRDVLVTRRGSTDDDRVARFLDSADHLAAGLFRDIDLFVCCFCEDGDLLSQWRGYSHGGGTYALGLDSESFHKPGTSGEAPSSLYPVIYEPTEQKRIVSEVLSRSVKRHLMGIKAGSDESPIDALGLLGICLSFCLILFKHDSFAAEREWRLVTVRRPADDLAVSFTPQPWFPRPYTSVFFEGRALPLSDVRCGPAPEPELAQRSVQMLLAQYGYAQAPVSASRVPLRW